MDKEEIAMTLAKVHRREDDAITQIIRLLGAHESERNEAVKLLEVNPATFPSGIWPIALGADPPEIPYGSVVVEVTPAEYEDILSARLHLPNGWTLGETLYPNGR